MALGGGTFIAQNKKLPGAYINFVSAARASLSLSDRGIATMAVEQRQKIKMVQNILGYDATHEKMKGLRDLFLNASTLYLYKLNKGEKATNTYATAKYSGERGNALKVVIAKNVDEQEKFERKDMYESLIQRNRGFKYLQEQFVNDKVKIKNLRCSKSIF